MDDEQRDALIIQTAESTRAAHHRISEVRQDLADVRSDLAEIPEPSPRTAFDALFPVAVGMFILFGVNMGIGPLLFRSIMADVADEYAQQVKKAEDGGYIVAASLEQIADTPQRIVAEVRRTVLHEIAHHFGISDKRLR